MATRTYPPLEERQAWHAWLVATSAARGMTLVALARRLDLGEWTVKQYGEGRQWPSDERRAAIARILGDR